MKRFLIAFIFFILILSCSKEENNKNQTQGEQTLTQTAQYKKTDYYFKLPAYNGGEIDLENYAGRPVLVMFFTKNCPYCQKAAPFIQKMYMKYSSKGLGVIAISIWSDKESATEFAQMFNLTFDIAYDGMDIARNYGAAGVPFIYLLDKDHKLQRIWAGYDKSYDLNIEESISKML